jgi:hypothetical protein
VGDLLNKAAVVAIKDGIECITPEMIEDNHWGILGDNELKEMLR